MHVKLTFYSYLFIGISGISPGQGVTVEVFSEENYQGQSTTITNAEDSGRLFRKKYPNGDTVNDNVKSFKIVADVSNYFAGANCGIATSICMGVKSYAETVARPDRAGFQLSAGCTLRAASVIPRLASAPRDADRRVPRRARRARYAARARARAAGRAPRRS